MNDTNEENTALYNGIDAITGGYLAAPSVTSLAAALRGEPPSTVPSDLVEREARDKTGHLALEFGVDDLLLDQSGWGLLTAYGASHEILDALAPLREHRRNEARARYKEFTDARAYRPGDTVAVWLGRQSAAVGVPQVNLVPYYLLIVGSPDEIPFDFQYELSVMYAVGRLHFDTINEYRAYALNVVAGEAPETLQRQRRATFVGVSNPDDRATTMSSTMLVDPLYADALSRHPEWQFEHITGGGATKAALATCLASSPSLIFTASHGMGFPSGHPAQRAHQGALLCQDWKGPLAHRGPITPELYFSADDVADDTDLTGTVLFQFACFGAGTPADEDFGQPSALQRIAPADFVARLPQRLLGKSKGALGVVGHVERAWSYSFASPQFGPQTDTFKQCMHILMSGRRLGFAMDQFSMRHAALAVQLNRVLDNIRHRASVPDHELVGLWTMHNDARNYVILGDPAVRIAAQPKAGTSPGM